MKAGARVMALDDPTSKMSKSAENIHSRISLLDEDNKIKKSIMKSTTDSEGVIRFDIENKPGISNLLNIYSTFSGKAVEDIVDSYAGCGYGDFKKDLVAVTQEAMAPIRQNFNEIRESQELLDVLNEGGAKANAIAQKTLARVKDAFGLGF
jgi:tryptophanyl-tRNA synthetase